MRKRSKNISWLAAAEWIALNDDPDCFDIDMIIGTVSVAMVSDLTGISQEQVADRVLVQRKIWRDSSKVGTQHLNGV